MGLFTPIKCVRNWYRYDVGMSIELIMSFVEGVERQAKDSIEKFKGQTGTVVLEYDDPSVTHIHGGLDDATWDLEGVFCEFFPTLQRRSAFLSVIGMFEFDLDELCRLYEREKSMTVMLSDMRGKGIERSVRYLEKVAVLDVYKNSSEWREIKDLQKIRNLIAHRAGMLSDGSGDPMTTEIDYINRNEWLERKAEVVIKEGFLKHVVDVYSRYWVLLDKSIQAIENVGKQLEATKGQSSLP